VLALLLLLLSLVPLEVVEFPLPAVQGLLRFLMGLERVLQPFFGLAQCPFPRLTSPGRTRHVCVERRKKKERGRRRIRKEAVAVGVAVIVTVTVGGAAPGKRGCVLRAIEGRAE